MRVLHPHHAFALAYACKTRCCCSCCPQKRQLLYGEWVEENVLAPVPHWLYVFTIPRLIGKIYEADPLECPRGYLKRCTAREAYRLSYPANHPR